MDYETAVGIPRVIRDGDSGVPIWFSPRISRGVCFSDELQFHNTYESCHGRRNRYGDDS